MEHANKGTDKMSNGGFYLITLNVILQGWKGRKWSKLGMLLLFAKFIKKMFDITAFWDDIDDIHQLSRDGFD